MTYTDLNEARSKIQERVQLQKEVELEWNKIGLDVPFDFQTPTAILGKPAMFRIETAMSIHMAEQADLSIAWLTYDSDKYVDASSIKRSLVQPYFTEKFDKKGNFIVERVKLVDDLRTIHLKELDSLRTKDNEQVMGIHKKRLLQAYPQAQAIDMSAWVKKLGGNALSYYESYLSLFISHAILFEDYHGGESGTKLDAFTQKVFEPAFEKVKKKYGVEPVIVKLPWKPHYAYQPAGEYLQKWREIIIPKL